MKDTISNIGVNEADFLKEVGSITFHSIVFTPNIALDNNFYTFNMIVLNANQLESYL